MTQPAGVPRLEVGGSGEDVAGGVAYPPTKSALNAYEANAGKIPAITDKRQENRGRA